jgi:hypothetical protein
MGMSSAGPKSSEALDCEPIEPSCDLTSFFRENVARALAVRHLEPPESTQTYLAALLAGLGHDQSLLTDSLVERELAAQAATRSCRLELLRTLGDHALSYAGLFSAHRERRGISQAYIDGVGTRAYKGAFALAQQQTREQAGQAFVYLELSRHFATYRAVLDDVREATSLGTADDVLSLYERFTRTGSPALRKRLAGHGVFALEIAGDDEPA